MRIFKKLDIFILKAYLQLFAGTFFICLFIFLMQFIWRYVDDLIGKGLSWIVVAKFMWYSALTIVPISTPLAVLLSSLISFGNLGEKFELLSMKAAGIPLVRILRPVILFVAIVCVGSFYFQNMVGPKAYKNMYTLLYGMRTKSPELEIPEGIFYGDIPGYNLYVERKDTKTGMLYGVMIYTNTGGYEDTEIVLADSARLQSTEDHMHLKLTLYNGERFRNMDSQNGAMLRANIPYMRESFIQEVDIITFDTNLNLLDPNAFSRDATTKNLADIHLAIDSISAWRDSTAHVIYGIFMQSGLRRLLPSGTKDSLRIAQEAVASDLSLDSVYAAFDDTKRAAVWRSAILRAESMKAECSFRALSTNDNNYLLRKHYMEANKKYTLSLACLLFFFIGAPLGAIIRKGGLGVPVIISVIIFILYYMINASGENHAKVGEWAISFGTWLSSAILLPVGLFLTFKANKDSVVFNIEGYRNFFMQLLGLRSSRKLNRKEVIIDDPDYAELLSQLEVFSETCRNYQHQAHLRRIPNYYRIFFVQDADEQSESLCQTLESMVEQLLNSRDGVILARINDYPILSSQAHCHPFAGHRLNIALGVLLPLGLIFYFRIWRFRIRMWRDMNTIIKINTIIRERIIKQQYDKQS